MYSFPKPQSTIPTTNPRLLLSLHSINTPTISISFFKYKTTPHTFSQKMRLSCNGCRVLRKGCSESCTIRPCLTWISSPESQANATLFLAKFYGRAGLMNLINSGPAHTRPALFRSLLYEACGRFVNPVNGSVGLLWSGSWQLCQNAVDAVLKGDPIVQVSDEALNKADINLSGCDIRHIGKDREFDLHKVGKKSRTRFKRAGSKPTGSRSGSTGSHVSGSQNSEGSHVSQGELVDDNSIDLELKLGFGSVGRVANPKLDG